MSDILLTDTPAPGVLRLTLNRPEKRNALNNALRGAILAGLEAGGDVAVETEHGGLGDGESAVEVDRADHGLEGVLEGGGAVAPAGGLLAVPEPEAVGDAGLAGEGGEEGAVGQDRAATTEPTLALVREEMIELMGEHELEDRVAEELKALVVAVEPGRVLRDRGMGQGALKQADVTEGVSEAILQHSERRGGGSHDEAEE